MNGRPPRASEERYMAIFKEVVTEDRFREIVTSVVLEARGYRVVLKEDGSFDKMERDPDATPHTRLRNKQLIIAYMLGMPKIPIDTSPSINDLLSKFSNMPEVELLKIASNADEKLRKAKPAAVEVMK